MVWCVSGKINSQPHINKTIFSLTVTLGANVFGQHQTRDGCRQRKLCSKLEEDLLCGVFCRKFLKAFCVTRKTEHELSSCRTLKYFFTRVCTTPTIYIPDQFCWLVNQRRMYTNIGFSIWILVLLFKGKKNLQMLFSLFQCNARCVYHHLQLE